MKMPATANARTCQKLTFLLAVTAISATATKIAARTGQKTDQKLGFNTSTVSLEPRFPAAFEHEHVGELRFLAEAVGNFPAGIAAQAAAVDDDFFARRPNRQKLRQQFIPPVFIQRNRAGNVLVRELIVRPCINPDRSVAPFTCLVDSHHFRRRDGRAPRDLVTEIDRLASRGEKRQGGHYSRLACQ